MLAYLAKVFAEVRCDPRHIARPALEVIAFGLLYLLLGALGLSRDVELFVTFFSATLVEGFLIALLWGSYTK